MIKKIFFQSIFFNFFFLKGVFAAESGGMPQLNPEFWISQIFWLILTFGILYIVLSKLILPKISANLESRKSQIQENIEAAENQRESSVSKLKEYDEIINKSKIEAQNIFKEAREKVLKDISSKKNSLDKQINEVEDAIKNQEEAVTTTTEQIQQLRDEGKGDEADELEGQIEGLQEELGGFVTQLGTLKENKQGNIKKGEEKTSEKEGVLQELQSLTGKRKKKPPVEDQVPE